MILGELKRAGIDLVASLPDQWLGDLIKQCEADPAIKTPNNTAEPRNRRVEIVVR